MDGILSFSGQIRATLGNQSPPAHLCQWGQTVLSSRCYATLWHSMTSSPKVFTLATFAAVRIRVRLFPAPPPCFYWTLFSICVRLTSSQTCIENTRFNIFKKILYLGAVRAAKWTTLSSMWAARHRLSDVREKAAFCGSRAVFWRDSWLQGILRVIYLSFNKNPHVLETDDGGGIG